MTIKPFFTKTLRVSNKVDLVCSTCSIKLTQRTLLKEPLRNGSFSTEPRTSWTFECFLSVFESS